MLDIALALSLETAPLFTGGGLAPITLGQSNLTANTNLSTSQNTMQGAAWQVAADGVLNFISITGPTTTDQVCNFRLVLYLCTSQTVWSGAKLGQTAIQAGINANQTLKVPLIAPANVTAAQWVAVCVHADTPGFTMGARSAGQGDRFFSDTFSDDALATALASALNTTDTRCLLASTN